MRKRNEPLDRYVQHLRNAAARGIPFRLTFEDWWAIWQDSGKWDQRGWGKGQYCMARYGDKGAYELGNVRICTSGENRAERNACYPLKGEKNPAAGKDYWASNPLSRAVRAANMSARLKGKPKSPETRAKMSMAKLGNRNRAGPLPKE